MPAGFNLAETTIFVPGAVLGSATKELGENGFTALPHPFSATHHNFKDGNTVVGRMVDVLGLYSPLVQTLAVHNLDKLNNPVIIFPFIPSE